MTSEAPPVVVDGGQSEAGMGPEVLPSQTIYPIDNSRSRISTKKIPGRKCRGWPGGQYSESNVPRSMFMH